MSLLRERGDELARDVRPAIPNGWLGIALSDEISTGGLLSRHILGRDLVLFRGESGRLNVVDAYCPHLGAHLGGGCVIGEHLRCPFHHWEFDGAGQCAHIPYGSSQPAAARLTRWPACEVNGFVFIWHHPSSAEPTWEIPAHPIVGDRDFYFVETREHLFKAHPQDVSENGADFAHFNAIHGWDGVKLKFLPDAHCYRVAYDTDGVDTGYGDAGSVGVDSLAVGPGYTYTHYTGATEWLMLTFYTPVDPGVLYMRQAYYAHRSVLRPDARRLIDAVDGEWRKDIRIWENKIYQEKPVLNNGDGPIAQFRRWYAQFYV